MGPVSSKGGSGKDDSAKFIDQLITENSVVVFSKSFCPYCSMIKNFFHEKGIDFQALELNRMGAQGGDLQLALLEKTGQSTVPSVWINGKFIGGCEDTLKAAEETDLLKTIGQKEGTNFDYDILVVGGGSGGLAAAKEAANLGKKVALCDYVQPTPLGTAWGLGGTCVNVGCIPKKLMHQAALLGEAIEDARSYGWGVPEAKAEHNWTKLVQTVQNHIGSLNWGYRVQLRDKKVSYLNSYASFVDQHTVKTVNKKGAEKNVTAKTFILATGGRPRYPNIPGALELGITSDDLFSLQKPPGKTLLVGASYIALECAGFLNGLGFDTTVMVRSILLRGFDQQMAGMIGSYMEGHGVKFVRECVPTALEKADPEGSRVTVKAKYLDGSEYSDEFDTVIFAIGRDAETAKLGLDKVLVKLNPSNGKVITDEHEQSSAEHVYAIGDMLDGRPELTPVAIQAGKLLARRLCGQSDVLTNYDNVPTTVFTPLEYGCCGLAEEAAKEKFGEDKIEVYHSNFWPLEWTVAHRPNNDCYMKLIVTKDDNKVVGFHYLGPNAGEVTQGFAGMIALGATKDQFDDLIGIHPTCAEGFTTLKITKSSGVDPSATGC